MADSAEAVTDASAKDVLEVAGRRMTSRLIVGTGKYKDLAENAAAVEAAGAEMVTVAVRRVATRRRFIPTWWRRCAPPRSCSMTASR